MKNRPPQFWCTLFHQPPAREDSFDVRDLYDAMQQIENVIQAKSNTKLFDLTNKMNIKKSLDDFVSQFKKTQQISYGRTAIAYVVALAASQKMAEKNNLLEEFIDYLVKEKMSPQLVMKNKMLLKEKMTDFLKEKKLSEKDLDNFINTFNAFIIDALEKTQVIDFAANDKELILKKLNKIDKYQNLFGLMNSYVAGSMAVVITQVFENGLGIPDVDPSNGMAPINRANDINDRDDPSNAQVAERYLQFGIVVHDVVANNKNKDEMQKRNTL